MYLECVAVIFTVFISPIRATSFNFVSGGHTDILSLEPIPVGTDKVHLNHNAFTVVPSGYFTEPTIYWIELQSNQISEIQPNAFSAALGLRDLFLRMNRLSCIKNDYFFGLFQLEVLELFSNDISSVEIGAFRDLRVLVQLDLNDNHLKSLDLAVFDPINHSTIPVGMELSGNEWVCDSNLAWLVAAMQDGIGQWIVERTYWTGRRAVCTEPPDLASLELASLHQLLGTEGM